MRIVIAGGSGLSGRRLTAAWLEAGDDVTVLTRNPTGPAATLGAGAVPLALGARRRSTTTRGRPPRRRRGRQPRPACRSAADRGRRATSGRSCESRLDATRRHRRSDEPAAGGRAPEGARERLRHRHLRRPPRRRDDRGVAAGRLIPRWRRRGVGARQRRRPRGSVSAWPLARTALIVAPEALAWRWSSCHSGCSSAGRSDRAGSDSPGSMSTMPSVSTSSRSASRSSGRSTWSHPRYRPSAISRARSAARCTDRRPSRLRPSSLRLALWGQADIVLMADVAVPAKGLAAGYEFRSSDRRRGPQGRPRQEMRPLELARGGGRRGSGRRPHAVRPDPRLRHACWPLSWG